MRNNIKNNITEILSASFALLSVFLVVCLQIAKQRAYVALKNLESSENAEFSMGEYENVAKGRCLFVTVKRRDINKSRLAGKYAAEKSKEFLKGWMDGEKSESKHK